MERRAVVVRGIVQGVGFRPFVHQLATRLDLTGFIRNDAGTVVIEIECDEATLDKFLAELSDHPPTLARIDQVTWESRPTLGETRFHIDPSQAGASDSIFLSPDVATCDDCLRELFDPRDRRYRYPFLNCTNCGPRLTIIAGAPYDRERTTMARFPMCAACRAEYDDPADRRFHAQPIACPACGPRLRSISRDGVALDVADPLAFFVDQILAGKVGALKGLGGYHLVCDARNENAVAELRARKSREDKPFALMVRDLEAAERLCQLSTDERSLLLSKERPIVLLRKREAAEVASSVAGANPFLGVMLPYTPLHHLLMHAVGDVPLVMTSGNLSDEPIAFEDDDARRRLAPVADVSLTHDRPIHAACDDSVIRVLAGSVSPVRRARGYAPAPVTLPLACPVPMLAVGGQLKSTFALGRGRHAFLSQHLGDLDHASAFRAFKKNVELYENLFSIRPEVMVHDLHPDYASTRYAQKRGGRLVPVQHHHAHMASCMAEHGLAGPVIGVTFDGTGYGTDGTIWGGEFLVGDYTSFRRVAHLRYVGMPGGEQAIREPWRMALAHLKDADLPLDDLKMRVPEASARFVESMVSRAIHCPPTSSVGRLFDAVAALLGVRDRVTFEGQAAIELETLASAASPAGFYPFDLVPQPPGENSPIVVDTRPIIASVAEDLQRDTPRPTIARRFHQTLAELTCRGCEEIRTATGLNVVVLSGGVFLNALLTEETHDGLRRRGFEVFTHRQVPTNDGGLSLGQLAVACAGLQ